MRQSRQIAHAYDPHLDRLLAVKRRVDPESLFSATPLPSGTPSTGRTER
jgi:hypothetical protein